MKNIMFSKGLKLFLDCRQDCRQGPNQRNKTPKISTPHPPWDEPMSISTQVTPEDENIQMV